MQILQKLIRFARKSRRDQLQAICYRLAERDWYWKIHTPGNDRTAYVIGLFGSGRWYITELIRQNIGERAKYFKDEIHFRPGPTSMIYIEHATIRHVSRFQEFASGNEPYIGSGKVGICRFEFLSIVIPSIRCCQIGFGGGHTFATT
jgi:hypothetical protein